MMTKIRITLLLCLSCLCAVLEASAQTSTPQGNADQLKQLDQLAETCRAKLQTKRFFAQSEAQAASASGVASVAFYLKALAETRYRDNPQGFSDWKRKNEGLITSMPFQTATMLQLRYLVLALKRCDSTDAYAQVPEYFSYLNSLAVAYPSTVIGTKSGRNGAAKQVQEALALLGQPIAKTSVAQWLDVSSLMPASDFEQVPGNYGGIMEKNVRGPLRDRKDPRLIATWDAQINLESKLAQQQDADSYRRKRYPSLIIDRAEDLVLVGQKEKAIGEMITLIKGNPDNPAAMQWIQSARRMLGASGGTNAAPPAGEAPLSSTPLPDSSEGVSTEGGGNSGSTAPDRVGAPEVTLPPESALVPVPDETPDPTPQPRRGKMTPFGFKEE